MDAAPANRPVVRLAALVHDERALVEPESPTEVWGRAEFIAVNLTAPERITNALLEDGAC